MNQISKPPIRLEFFKTKHYCQTKYKAENSVKWKIILTMTLAFLSQLELRPNTHANFIIGDLRFCDYNNAASRFGDSTGNIKIAW